MKSSLFPIYLFCLGTARGLALPPTDVASAQITEAPRNVPDADGVDVKNLIPVSSDASEAGSFDIESTVPVKVKAIPTGTIEELPSLPNITPQTTGLVITKLDTTEPTPLLTAAIEPVTKFLEPIPVNEKRDSQDESEELCERGASNIFAVPIGKGAPPSSIQRRSDHPVPRTGIVKDGPLQTNKFYSNFFVGDRTGPTYTYPYAVSWAKGQGTTSSWGLAISHTEASQRVFGPNEYNNAAGYFINPVGIQYMVLSADELGSDTVLNVDNINPFHGRVVFKKNQSAKPIMYFPLVQGMPYVSARFVAGTPLIQSGVFFKSMTKVSTDPKPNVRKYIFELMDGSTWYVYAYRTSGSPLELHLVNNGLARGDDPFTGIIQVTKDPKTAGSSAVLDDGAGIYPINGYVSGSVSGYTGTYSLTHSRYGHPQGSMYMYALPHHVDAFDGATKNMVTSLRMDTPTKGVATLVRGTKWTMIEPGMPTGMGLGPWKAGPRVTLSTAAKNAIRPIARSEISQNMDSQTNLDSMYFSGKALLKFAQIIYVVSEQLNDKSLAQAGLVKLKEAFAVFSKNNQKYPLVYESAWGGLVSSASYTTGDSGVDFGNTYYNDHHFHWGYHILAAAYIGYLDKSWIAANKDYVNTLVRDISNPIRNDPYFPESRSFDWYHGHSWAKGLFMSLDGKDQESSSEDIMSIYAVKMWGEVIGDTNMASRADLQITVARRSLRSYYLYTDDNKVQPSNFIGNKVAGILFENKIDHTTYFSDDIESIQGIHMIPIHAPTGFSRSNEFIRQEWDAFFSNGRIDKIDNAWKGIIYANYALVAPRAAWNFFSQSSFSGSWLDGGASRTWYMAYTAAIGKI